MKTSLFGWVLAMVAALPLVAQSNPPAGITAQTHITQGKRIFEMNCSVGYCHGLEGSAGKGPRLRDRVWAKSYLYRTIEKGIPNSSMPAWEGRLTNQSIDAVVAYIISISHEQSEPETAENNGPTESAKNVVARDVIAGKQLFFDPFKDRNCGTCHRVAGSGTPIASDLPNISRRSDKALLGQIINRPAGYALVQLNIKDGDTVCGVKGDDADGVVHIYDLAGAGPPVLRTIDRTSLKMETPCTKVNVHQTNSRDYTAEELASIVSYLKSLP